MNGLVSLFETLAGMVASPITLITVVIAFSFGLWRPWWWIPVLVAVVADGVSALVFYKQWVSIGIDLTTQIWKGAFLFAIFAYSAFAIARLLKRLLHKFES